MTKHKTMRLVDGTVLTWRNVRALQDRGQADRRSFVCDACGVAQLLQQACRLGPHAVCLACAMRGVAVSEAVVDMEVCDATT